MAGVILDTGTKSRFPHHFHIKIRPPGDPLGLQKLVLTLKIFHPLFQLNQDIFRRFFHLLLGHNIMRCRENGHMTKLCPHLSCHRIDLLDPIHLITEKLDPECFITRIRRIHFQYVPTDTESSPLKVHVVAVVLDIDQFMDHLIPVLDHTRPQGDHHLLVIDRAS